MRAAGCNCNPGQRRYGPTKSKALVCEWEDGTRAVYYRGERLAFTELKEPIRKTARPIPPAARLMVVRKAKPDHPWRQSYQNMKPRVLNQEDRSARLLEYALTLRPNYRASLQCAFQRDH